MNIAQKLRITQQLTLLIQTWYQHSTLGLFQMQTAKLKSIARSI